MELARKPKTHHAPFASLGEFAQALARHTRDRIPDPRLRMLAAASGASEGVGADGGYLIHPQFADGIFQRVYNTGLLLSRVEHQTIGANSNGLIEPAVSETSRADGSRFGGVQSFWASEADAITASKPGFELLDLKLHKLTALVYVTDDLLSDSSALDGYLRKVASLELQFKVEDAIFRGSGAGKPEGILGSNAKITIAKESGQAPATIVYQNVVNMYSRMWGGSLPNAAWLINQNILPQLYSMSLATGTGGVPVYSPANNDIDAGSQFGTMFGCPVIPSEYAESLGTEGDIIFADFSQYLMIDKGAPTPTLSLDVRFTNDEAVFKFTYRVDGQPTWRAPVTPYKGTQTQSPFISLATR